MKFIKSHIVKIIFYILIIGIIDNSSVYDENNLLLLETEVEEILEELETEETYENSLKTQSHNSRNYKNRKNIFISNLNLSTIFSKPYYDYSQKTITHYTNKSVTKLPLFILFCSLKLDL